MSTTIPATRPETRRALIESLPAAVGRVLDSDERRVSLRMTDLEVRDGGQNGDGSYTFTGTAAVFNTVTTLYCGKLWMLQEQIAPGAFTNVLSSPDLLVHLNVGHDMNMPLARLSSVGPDGTVGVGGMKLWQDMTGLRVFARLNAELSTVRDLAVLMADGVVDQMSFAFRIGRESLATTVDGDQEIDLWTIEEVSELYDVCVCAQGAYPTTSAALRTAIGGLRHAGIDPAGLSPRHCGLNPSGGPEVMRVTNPAGGQSIDQDAETARLVAMRAREIELAEHEHEED